ncbi:hypothetical protein SKPI104516_19630 [Skermania piniformis]
MEDPVEPVQQNRCAVLVEDIVEVLQLERQSRAQPDDQSQRVVRRLVERDVDQRQSVDLLRTGGEAGGVHGVGLEDDQGVEFRAGARRLLDVDEPDELVIEQAGLFGLKLDEDVGDPLPGGEAQPDGEGVDEQADHRFDTGQIGRPAGNGGAEGDVLPVEEAAEQDGPYGLDDGIGGDPEPGGEFGDPLGVGDVEFGVHRAPVTGDLAAGSGMPGDQGGFVRSAEGGRPILQRHFPIDLMQPLQIAAIRRHRGQYRVGLGGVADQQLLQQHRHRPAVEHDVVAGDDQFGGAGSGSDQGEPHQRRSIDTERGHLIGRDQPVDLVGRGHRIQVGEVDLLPPHRDVVEHQLHRVAGPIVGEGGAQVRVPIDDHLRRRTQPIRIDRTGQVQHDLGQIDVGGPVGEQRVEQQAGLQRRQRPDVGECGVLRGPAIDLGLAHLHQRYVGRGETAGIRAGGIVGQRSERPLPRIGQLLHIRARDRIGRERERRIQYRSGSGVGDDRVDVDRLVRRTVRVAGRVDRSEPVGG